MSWDQVCNKYNPEDYTAPHVMDASREGGWADAEEPRAERNRWRKQGTKNVREDKDGRPLNPAGRTGLRGRGSLGHWGPNPVVDTIITRHRQDHNGRWLYEMLAERRGNFQYGIPGAALKGQETEENPGVGWKLDALATYMEEHVLEGHDKDRFRTLWQELKESAEKVYEEPAHCDESRDTDNAWLVSEELATARLPAMLALHASTLCVDTVLCACVCVSTRAQPRCSTSRSPRNVATKILA